MDSDDFNSFWKAKVSCCCSVYWEMSRCSNLPFSPPWAPRSLWTDLATHRHLGYTVAKLTPTTSLPVSMPLSNVIWMLLWLRDEVSSHLLSLDWTWDLFWPAEWGENNVVGIPNIDLKLQFKLSWNAALQLPYGKTWSNQREDERPCEAEIDQPS